MIDQNIKHWINIEESYQKEQTQLHETVALYMKDHEIEMIRMAGLKTTISENEYKSLEKGLRRLMVRVDSVRSRADISANVCWWILQHIRACYRRKCVIEGNLCLIFFV